MAGGVWDVLFVLFMKGVKGRPTLRHVARRAGVSIQTVSGVLNNRTDLWCSQETIERVRRVVAEMNYQPNAAARGLRLGKFQAAGLLVEDVTNPHYMNFARELRRVLAGKGYSLVIEDAELSLSAGHMALENLSRQNVDGIFVMASSDKRFSGLFEAIERVGLPLVFVGGRGHRYGDCVDLDYASGLREAARHLAGLGHRRVAFVCGLPEGERVSARQRLYAGALRDAGLRFHASLFVECEPTCDGAARAAKALLGTGNGRRPTAIVAVNDLLAIGVVRAIREMGLRVPEDISVVGNDNLSVGEHQPVALTTLSAPLRELAEAAASCFLSRQKKGGAGRGEGSAAVKLPVALVARESTARASGSFSERDRRTGA